MPDLQHTVAVITAAALGRDDYRDLAQSLRARQLAFTLKAAATQEAPQLPQGPWFDGGRQMQVRTSALDGSLQLEFQAQGYAAMRRWARREARLLAQRDAERIIDQRFRFSAEGKGLVVVADTPEVRAALGDFQLLSGR